MKAFYKDMSKPELLSMREQGMSNAEIAKSLDVSYTTVLNLIGKQPKGVRKPYVRGAVMKREEPELEDRTAYLMVEKSDLYVTGAVARYRLHPDRDYVSIIDEDYEEIYKLEADKLETFIRELQAIARNIENSKQTLTMW